MVAYKPTQAAVSACDDDSIHSDEYDIIDGTAITPLVDEDGLNEFGEREIVIAVMGVTGAGKSYLIRQITEQDVEVGDGLEGCTQKVLGVTMRYKGSNVTLLDSPGFSDTYRSDTDVLQDISSYLSNTYSQGIKLSGIIYLHPIKNTRMEGPSRRSLSMFRKLVGADAMHNVILATTHWDGVPPDVGQKREGELKAKFWADMINNGARVARVESDGDSTWELLNMLIGQDRVVLDIQREMVDERLNLIDTGAGKVLNKEILEMRTEYEKQLNEAKTELKEAIQKQDEQGKKEMAKVIEEFEEKLEAAEENSRALGQISFKREWEQRELLNKLHLLQLANKKEKDGWQKKQEALENRIEEVRKQATEDGRQARSGPSLGEVLPHVANIADSAIRAFIMYLNLR